jgi:hypothetical protein
MDHNRNTGWALAAAALLLPLVYIGSYVLLLDPAELAYDNQGSVVLYRVPFYRPVEYTNELAILYRPVHWLDAQLRQSYWNERTMTRDEVETLLQSELLPNEMSPPP